jgi:beta-lactamase superfamily II metal-dependent hydrolase
LILEEEKTMRLVVCLLLCSLAVPAASTLDIYWIDVEGGAATLIVTQAGETVLMDAGWPGFDGRDAERIRHVLVDEAGAQKLNYFITSHFHGDHAGGLPQLAQVVPIEKFVDHGDSVEQDSADGMELWNSYLRVSDGKRMQIKAGDKLPLEEVELLFVIARSRTLPKPLGPAGPNAACKNAELKDEDRGENGKSVGFLVRTGNFSVLDLGDLTWNYEYQLACPQNLLGEVDLYQVTHHGMDISNNPQLVWGIKPQVAVMNNGPRKGGSPATYEVLRQSSGIEDVWQVHRSLGADDAHNTQEKLTANLEETADCKGHWIRASVQGDGSYTITNSRNRYSKTYKPR